MIEEAVFVLLVMLVGAIGIVLVGIFWPDIEELNNEASYLLFGGPRTREHLRNPTGHKRVKRSIRRQAKRDVLPNRRTPYQRRKDLAQRVREIQQREVMTVR